MSSSARCSSQLSEDLDSSSSSLGVFGGGRWSGTSLNRDYERQNKRQKLSGTNSRFDRMIETVKMMHHSPVKASRQHRTRSVGSSTTSHRDVSQTPADAYEGRGTVIGSLGKDFAPIRMNARHTSGPDESLHDALKTASGYQDPKSLPPWLSNTLTGLDYKHPLRLLLPKSHRPPPPPGLVDQSEATNSEDESVFAFRRPDLWTDPVADGHVNLEDDNSHPSDSLKTLKVLPFSTPGPGSLLSKLIQPLSPTMHASSRVPNTTLIVSRHDSCSDAGVRELEFVPYATPGPGSLLLTEDPPSKFSRVTTITEVPMVVNDPNTGSFSDPIPFSTPGPTSLATPFIPFSLADSSFRLPADSYLSSYVAPMSEIAPGYSSDDIPDYSAYCYDSFADDSTSDPLLDPFAYTQPLPNIFATPGPGYRPPQQIYFDSPTEDPSDSDPLQPGYEVDYDSLDFRWEPFNPKDTQITDSKENMTIPLHHSDPEVYVDTGPERPKTSRAPEHDQSNPVPSSPKCMLSPGPFAFSVDETYTTTSSHESSAQQRQRTPECQRGMSQVFAPAPGIFLSPLVGSVLPNFLDGSHCQPRTPDNKPNLLSALDQLYEPSAESSVKHRSHAPSNSQESIDSIESWQDQV